MILDVDDGSAWTANRDGSIGVYDESNGVALCQVPHDMQCPLAFALVESEQGGREVWAARADGNIIIFDRASRCPPCPLTRMPMRKCLRSAPTMLTARR